MATINIFGEKFQGLGKELQISSKLGVSLPKARSIIRGDYKNIYFRDGTRVKKIDTSSPLAIQEAKSFTGAKRFSKSRALSGQTIKGKKATAKGITGRTKLFVTYQGWVEFSPPARVDVKGSFYILTEDTTPSDVEDAILQNMGDRYQIFENDRVGLYSYNIFDEANGNLLEFGGIGLREVTYPDISEIYDVDHKLLKEVSNGDCAKTYMKIVNKRKQKKTEEYKTWNLDTITDYVKVVNTRAEIWDILGNKVLDYTPDKQDKNSKKVKAIAYSNHIYPLKKAPNKQKKPYKKIVVVPTGEHYNEVKKTAFIKDVSPYGKTLEVTEYIWCNTLYIVNPDYEQVQEILKEFNITIKNDYDRCKQSLHSVGYVIAKKEREEAQSFFPFKVVKPDFSYSNEDLVGRYVENIDEVLHYDKNSCYLDSLINLQYLFTCDFKTGNYINNPTKLENNYMYLVKPHQSTILLPVTNIYCYDHLMYCQRIGLTFDLLEGFEINTIPNTLAPVIKKVIEKFGTKIAKKIFITSGFVGTMNRTENYSTSLDFVKACTYDEAKAFDGHILEQGSGFTCWDVKTKIHINDLRPVLFQIKDYARVKLYEDMMKQGITQNQILKINTDSITYIGKPFKESKEVGKWKNEKPKYTEEKFKNFLLKKVNFNGLQDTKLVNKSDNKKNIIHDCYAGVGKTHKIMKMIKEGLTDYVVFTPSHETLNEYRLVGNNCDVIQRYEYNNSLIPKEKNIIIDEHGMMSGIHWAIVYVWSTMGKNIISFGDFKQLPPITRVGDKPICSDYFLSSIFYKAEELTKNYRNNFTKEYYDNLINEKLDLRNEVLKHSTKKPEDAEIIIVRYNYTKRIYDTYMMKHLGYTNPLNEKTLFLVKEKLTKEHKGLRVMCKANDLGKEYGIYNNFTFTIEDVDVDTVTLKNSNGEITTVPLIKMGRFQTAYAKTTYGVQGKSLKSYYIAVEDWEEMIDEEGNKIKLSPLKGFEAYVIVSRIKQKRTIKIKIKKKSP